MKPAHQMTFQRRSNPSIRSDLRSNFYKPCFERLLRSELQLLGKLSVAGRFSTLTSPTWHLFLLIVDSFQKRQAVDLFRLTEASRLSPDLATRHLKLLEMDGLIEHAGGERVDTQLVYPTFMGIDLVVDVFMARHQDAGNDISDDLRADDGDPEDRAHGSGRVILQRT